MGREIERLIDDNQEKGGHNITLNALNLKDGTYFIY